MSARLGQWARRLGQPRGRILRVAPGYNPNSSSLGVEVSFLLFGSMAVTAITLVAGTAMRLWGRHERTETAPAPDGPSAEAQ